MKLTPAMERARLFLMSRRRLLGAMALIVTGLLWRIGQTDDAPSLLAEVQADRGVLAGAGRDSPASTLTHPWTGSSPEWDAEVLANLRATDDLMLSAFALGDQVTETDGSPEAAASGEPADAPPPEPHPEPAPSASPPPAPRVSAPVPVRTSPPPPPPPTATPRPPAPAPVAGQSSLEQQVFDGQNAERSRAGLAPLRLDAGLQGVARRRATDMATRGYFSHTSPTGETAFSLIDAAGIDAPYAGENIGFNNHPDSQSALSVLQAFMASPTHRANIINSRYTRVGVALAVSPAGMKYYAVVFAGP